MGAPTLAGLSQTSEVLETSEVHTQLMTSSTKATRSTAMRSGSFQ